jgi:MOSC domain-containing protein YiiM
VLAPGAFGENLTTLGIDVTGALIGERWRIRGVLLEVTAPRVPCSVFKGFIGEKDWIKRFTDGGRPGAYLRVLEEGHIQGGDAMVVEHRPAHGVSIAEVFRARSGDDALVPRLLLAPELSEPMRKWAQKRTKTF